MTGTERVLVVFSDGTLGGTSRSAMTMGAAWRAAGVDVDFCALDGVHPQRLDALSAIGRLVGADDVVVDDLALIHLHHARIEDRERRPFSAWAAAARRSSKPPALLTHNVFGVAGLPLERWPGPTAVGVLGEWVRRQYTATRWPRPAGPVVVVPNPQDLAFFRPPSPAERDAARRSLSGEGAVVLRVGSPSDGKWSEAYLLLAAEVARVGGRLVCVGAPPRLAERLGALPGVQLLPLSPDSEALRRLYWAADVLAVDARQGESFGNVILEALGCGTPVVYRDRPTRDDTPREFPVVIARGERAWVRATVEQAVRPRSVDAEALRPYSVEAVARLLRRLLDARLDLVAVDPHRPRIVRFPGDRAAIGLRHLPPGRTLLAAARALRSRVVAPRRPRAPGALRG